MKIKASRPACLPQQQQEAKTSTKRNEISRSWRKNRIVATLFPQRLGNWSRWWEQNVAHRTIGPAKGQPSGGFALVDSFCLPHDNNLNNSFEKHDEKDDNAAEGHDVGCCYATTASTRVVRRPRSRQNLLLRSQSQGSLRSVDGFMLVAAPREMLLTYLCRTNPSQRRRRRYGIPEDCCWRFFQNYVNSSFF